MKIIKKKYCVFLLILLNSCDLFNGGCGCVPPPYRLELVITLREIKDPSVKSIKVTLKNLDGIKPEFEVYDEVKRSLLEKKAGIYILTEQKRDKHVYRGETYYFEGVERWFIPPWDHEKWDFILGKKRIYELKTYINDGLFFTKKISFITKENEEGYLYADKVEVDNMDYVIEISNEFRPGNHWIIGLTDVDIKDKL